MGKNKVKYPFIPKGETILYAPADNPFMQAAREYARRKSFDKTMPTGAVVVLDGEIIGRGANGSDYHEKFGCERVRRGIPTGEGYELCEGCHPRNHSEPKAVADALQNHSRSDLAGAELYLWGHWWACEPCWKAITKAGIRKVYLMEDSHRLYNKAHPENIVGKQFV